MKAILEQRGEVIQKTHALPILLDKCSRTHPMLTALREDMIKLSVYAIEFRYPGESATAEDAKTAMSIMKTARTDLRGVLGNKV